MAKITKKDKKTIGKMISQERAKIRKTKDPKERAKIVDRIKELEAKRLPGSIIFLKDSTFFQKTGRRGHLYVIDEYSGKKIAVNRISHHDHLKMSKYKLKDTPSKKNRGSVQLDVIYFGRKGKPIKYTQGSLPLSKSDSVLSKQEKYELNRLAKRDPQQKKKWGSKK